MTRASWSDTGADRSFQGIKDEKGGIKDHNDTRHMDWGIVCVDAVPGRDF